MSRLAVSMLGSMRVTVGGEPVTRFRGDTVQALLAYLVMHPGITFRRQVLAGMLWPDHRESEALVNLRQTLRRLRTAIADDDAGSPFLATTRTTLTFAPESDHWLDVAAFDQALSEIDKHAHTRLESCPACARRLEEAIDLYRGDFLQGFSLDSALFEEWMVVERERLHRQALEALGHLAACHEESGEYERALAYARRQVELEPWRESAHRQWMRALALSGQRGAALAQYEACRRILADELGVEPGPETAALYECIRSGGELAVGGARPPHNLPAQLTPFIGREAELAEIAERLADPSCRLLTLVGPGGSSAPTQTACFSSPWPRCSRLRPSCPPSLKRSALLSTAGTSQGSSCSATSGTRTCSWYWITMSTCFRERAWFPRSYKWRQRLWLWSPLGVDCTCRANIASPSQG
jgi:DNA-binding SARP family transcriptional activator